MTAPIIGCDISYYQVPVNDSYTRRWLIFRCCDAGFHDPNCDTNKAWASKAVAAKRIDGWTAYGVFRPGRNAAILDHAAMLPPGGHVMVDVENWSGQIRGDHSAEINSLLDGLRRMFPGQLIPGVDRVWAYGNRADLADIYPNRGNTQVVVAGYGSRKPTVPNMIGWQYTDGVWISGSRPISSAPFGPCDHNELYIPPSTPEVDVPLTAAEKAEIAALAASAVWSYGIGGGPTNKASAPASVYLRDTNIVAQNVGASASAAAASAASAAKVLTDPTGVVARVADLGKQLADLKATVAALHTTVTDTSGATVPDLAPVQAEIVTLQDSLAKLTTHLGGTA